MIVAIALHPDDWARFSRGDRKFMKESLGKGGKILKDDEVPRGEMRVDVEIGMVGLGEDHHVEYKWDTRDWIR